MEFIENVSTEGKREAEKRPQHSHEYLNGVYRCGERRKHEIRLHRSKWPPKQHAGLTDGPFVVGTCENCGATCIVYDPVPSDMTVLLYGEAGSERGQVREDEPGQVMNEADVPPAGQVLEEPKGKGGRR